MSDTLLFIHGTGVRQAGYHETMARLAKGLSDAGRRDIKIAGYPWGDDHGARIDAAVVDAVLPQAQTRAIGGDPSQWEAALWEQLLADPLFELRMAAIREGTEGVGTSAPLPGAAETADVVVSMRVDAFAQTVQDPLPGGVPAATIGRAAAEIAQTPELSQAALAAPAADDADLTRAIARAVVASALVACRGEVGAGPEALYVIERRRELVQVVAGLVGPTTRDIGGWLFDRIKGAAEAWATGYGTKRRSALVLGAGPAVGDILLYQRRGDAILDGIEAEIVRHARAGERVVVLGHSLGGIMLVDLLSRPRSDGALPVERLVTVGSQAPALFVCDALGTMRPGQAQAPVPFTPWLNMYDRNDFLSFCASRCFPGVTTGIEDFEVRSGVSFPDAHGAYFHQQAFYAKLIERWP